MGMVFQSYAIWPHMTVFENAAFPLQVSKSRIPRKEIANKVLRVLKVVALEDLAEREATKLSGGQQQRLALARALVMEPPLLLLDEPLSNLDAKLRERMRFELKRLQRDLGITTVYVTHDQSEALALSHSVAVMDRGRIQQTGAPREIYERPANQFVADFIGTTNFLRATVDGPDAAAGFYRVASEVGTLKVRAVDALEAGTKVVISVRPEDIRLSETPPSGDNVLEGTVHTKVFLGESVDFEVKINQRLVLSRAHPSLGTRVGHPIHLSLDPEKCVALKETPE
jgi:iron(III) transport system ATP-binding protein